MQPCRSSRWTLEVTLGEVLRGINATASPPDVKEEVTAKPKRQPAAVTQNGLVKQRL
jgi:hypothetical protein